MKANTRAKLYCYKFISNDRVRDAFEVVVPANEVTEWKKFYEDLGYSVSSVRN